jgi:hypothetical protein
VTASPWRQSWRADPDARWLADRHYNRQTPGADGFVPPGRCFVLKTRARSPWGRWPAAVWVTSWQEFTLHRWAGAWVNSLFRYEAVADGLVASDLIRWAVAHTRHYWPAVPAEGIITFVDRRAVEAKPIPGWCYLRAGWSRVGVTIDDGLDVWQQLPDRKIARRSTPMPAAAPVPGWQPPLFDLDEVTACA